MNWLIGKLISNYGDGLEPNASPLESFLEWSSTVTSRRQWMIGRRQAWGILQSMARALAEVGQSDELPHYEEAVSLVARLKMDLRSHPLPGDLDLRAWRSSLARLQEVNSLWECAAGLVACPGCSQMNPQEGWTCVQCGATLPASAELWLDSDVPSLPPEYQELGRECEAVLQGNGDWDWLSRQLQGLESKFEAALRNTMAAQANCRELAPILDSLQDVCVALRHMLCYAEHQPSRLRDGMRLLAQSLAALSGSYARLRESR